MECLLTGNQIKRFHRAITCLAKIGNELLIEALHDKLVLRTLNASRSAFLSISFKAHFFDSYRVLVPTAHCSVLLKSVCTVFRIPPSSIDRLAVILPDMEASKLQWTLECIHGIRKTYWITCSNDPEMQHVALDRKNFPSHLVVKPSDLNRLLVNFQPSLQEITLIATEPSPMSPGLGSAAEGKAIELRSYIDPAKENNDSALHTQLWIDPTEELLEYLHKGDAVDVTFSLKELKAFLGYCEGSEADMHFYFEEAGKPILLAPRFGLDDSDHADFDATLVLATMLGSQLRDSENGAITLPQAASNQKPKALNGTNINQSEGIRRPSQRDPKQSLVSEKGTDEQSEHTKIWSELSGSATKSWEHREAAREPLFMQDSNDASEEIPVGMQQQFVQPQINHTYPIPPTSSNMMNEHNDWLPHVTENTPNRGDQLDWLLHATENTPVRGYQVPPTQNVVSKGNPGNWVSADMEDDEDDDEGDELCVQSTPPRRRV